MTTWLGGEGPRFVVHSIYVIDSIIVIMVNQKSYFFKILDKKIFYEDWNVSLKSMYHQTTRLIVCPNSNKNMCVCLCIKLRLFYVKHSSHHYIRL